MALFKNFKKPQLSTPSRDSIITKQFTINKRLLLSFHGEIANKN